MLFTETAGEDLRKQLKKSKTPVKDMFLAGMKMDVSFVKWLKEQCKNEGMKELKNERTRE